MDWLNNEKRWTIFTVIASFISYGVAWCYVAFHWVVLEHFLNIRSVLVDMYLRQPLGGVILSITLACFAVYKMRRKRGLT